MIFLLFIIGVSLRSTFNQLIVTSQSKGVSLGRIKAKYDEIYKNDLPSIFVNRNFSSFDDETMTIDKITYSTFSIDTSPYFSLENHIIVYSPRQIYINFNFRATMKNSAEIINDIFTMKITSISIKEKHENYQFTPQISIDVSENDFAIENRAMNAELKEKILNLIRKHFFVDNNQIFETQFYSLISSNINIFYKDVKNIDIALSEQFGGEQINISMNTFCGFCSDVKLTGETIQCYYMGNVTEKQYFDRQGDIEEYDDFFKEDGKFKMFVSYLVINDTMNTDAFKSVEFDLNEKTKPEQSDKLIVDNLIYFFPNLYKVMSRKAIFHVKSKIDSVKVTGINTGNAIMINNFYFNNDDTKSDIILQTEIMFNIKYTSFATNINVCFDNVKVVKTKNKSSNIIQKLEHVSEFNTLLQTIFNSYISEGLCLYKNKGMNFIEYFKLIEELHVGKNGLFLKGKSM